MAVVAGFFAYFWTHGGQTLGMSAWRLRLVRADGGQPRLADALIRLVCAVVALAPAGLGLLWILIDRDGLAWHDRWSRTRLVLVKRDGNAPYPTRRSTKRAAARKSRGGVKAATTGLRP